MILCPDLIEMHNFGVGTKPKRSGTRSDETAY